MRTNAMKKCAVGAMLFGGALGLAQAAQAAIIVETNAAIWNAQVGPMGTETFAGVADGFYAAPVSGSVAGITWEGSATNGIYVDSGLFSTNFAETLTFTFSPGVRAVAGNFFGTDINFNIVSVTFTVQLGDGTGYSGAATSINAFTGFYSTTAATISSLSITVQNAVGSGAVFPTVDNLYFGSVPAPGAIALLGMAGLAGSRRRRA